MVVIPKTIYPRQSLKTDSRIARNSPIEGKNADLTFRVFLRRWLCLFYSLTFEPINEALRLILKVAEKTN